MAWHIEGTYFENCNCNTACPCSTSGLTAPADNDRCNAALAFHVDTGEVNGVDVGGLTVCVIGDAPALMSEGGWKLGMLVIPPHLPSRLRRWKLCSADGSAVRWKASAR